MNANSRDGALRSLVRSMSSWRTAAVSLLSFSSGLPLGLVWYAIPDWMRASGTDIRIVGLFTLTQAPWTFKVLWSPLMDRYVPPFWGRRRGWMAVTQMLLAVCGFLLAGVGNRPDTWWVVGALALGTAIASASQDVAIDAYAVEVLQPDEQGVASGARTAVYRVALLVSGGLAITAAGRVGWPLVNALLAAVYIPILFLTWYAPEPDVDAPAPRSLRDAVWLPFTGFLARDRALEILAFVVLYKLADQLAQALTRPFLIDMGYNADQRGIALATIGVVATIGGAFIGGWVTTIAGLGRSLWIFGVLQLVSNLGYYALARIGHVNVPAMYAATSFELVTGGMGTGAFSVLLLRLTERRFSATQYALFSSLFALPRVVAGPITGFMVDAMGWSSFFLSTLVMGLPGLLMLGRFVPLRARELEFTVRETGPAGPPLSTGALAARGTIGALVAGAGSLLLMAALAAIKSRRDAPASPLSLADAVGQATHPTTPGDWIQIFSLLAFALVAGVFTAAASAARRGMVEPPA